MINILLIQPDITWEKPDENMVVLEGMMKSSAEEADLILMPELFTTGFTMRSRELAESMEGRTMAWMASKAIQFQTDLAGSLIIRENGQCFNRFIWMHQDGSYHWYDKRHLFRMSGEDKHYSSGREIVNIRVKGFRFRPLVCYDLRFPVWSRNRDDYDVLIYSANWPAKRMEVWKTLLRARALENQAFSIGVNRVGVDAERIRYTGESVVFDAKGKEIAYLGKDKSCVKNVVLSLEDLSGFREKFPVWKDSDSFSLND